jgi:hypothetical protein
MRRRRTSLQRRWPMVAADVVAAGTGEKGPGEERMEGIGGGG